MSGFDALHLPQYALSRLQKCDLLIIVISGGANREKEGTVSFISPGREADSSDDYLSRLVKKTSYYRRYQESLKNPEPTFEQQNPNAENIDKNITVREQLDLAQRISVNLKDPKPKVIFCFYGVDLDNQTMNIVNDSLELKKRRKRHQENKYVYVLNYPGWSPYVSDAWNKIDVFQVRKFAGLLLNELEKIEKWRLSSNFNKSNCLFKWFFGNDRLREYVPYNKT